MWDDAFRVGEYIDTGRLKGTVEALGVRSVKVRHHNGPLHTIPYGQLGAVTNQSRDFATIKFNLRLEPRHRYRAGAQDRQADRPRHAGREPRDRRRGHAAAEDAGHRRGRRHGAGGALQVHRPPGQAELDAARIPEAHLPRVRRKGHQVRLRRLDPARRQAALAEPSRRRLLPTEPAGPVAVPAATRVA